MKTVLKFSPAKNILSWPPNLGYTYLLHRNVVSKCNTGQEPTRKPENNLKTRVYTLSHRDPGKLITVRQFSVKMDTAKDVSSDISKEPDICDSNERTAHSSNRTNVMHPRNNGLHKTYNHVAELLSNKSSEKGLVAKNVKVHDSLRMIKELQAMAFLSDRDYNTIQLLIESLNEGPLDVSVKKLSDLLYVLSVLNIPNEALIFKITKQIGDMMDEIQYTPLLPGVLKSMNNLLIRDTDFLSKIIVWYKKHNVKSDNFSKVTDLIYTLALLNYFPLEGETLLSEIVNEIDPMNHSSTLSYLNFAWSLALLDRAKPEIIEPVLSHNFRKKMECITRRVQHTSLYLKLSNIHAYAKSRQMKINSEKHIYTSNAPWLSQLRHKQEMNVIFQSMIDSLYNMLPGRTLFPLIQSESGCVIDAVCYFDENEKPIPKHDYDHQKGHIMVAILISNFKDLCLPGKTIHTGIVEFHKNYLEHLGYRVVLIRFNDFPFKAALRGRINYLMKKLEEVVPNFNK